MVSGSLLSDYLSDRMRALKLQQGMSVTPELRLRPRIFGVVAVPIGIQAFS